MCGIFGVITKDQEYLDNSLMHGKNAVRRRGPDFEKSDFYEFDDIKVGFHHSRLAILDLNELANQPMSSSCGNWSIIFNGEIYNYIELRKELECYGVQFRTNSDTEVLLNAWILWGDSALCKLNGMFAFSILSKAEKKITLARDRYGVKPLYFNFSDEGFIFSSSISAISKIARPKINKNYIANGLFYKFYESNDVTSPFDGIDPLKPGHFVTIDFNSEIKMVEEKKWYDLSSSVQDKITELIGYTKEDLSVQCLSLLNDAIRIRLRTDVPYAVSLSGGMDSSTIAAIVASQNDSIAGFSYGHPTATLSEGSVVDRFSKTKKINTHYIWPQYSSSSLIQSLERTLDFQEAPFSSLSVIAQNEVFKSVRERGYKVLLGGQGGDEIFSGYRKFFLVALQEAIQSRDWAGTLYYAYSLIRMLLGEGGNLKTFSGSISRYMSASAPQFSVLNFVPDSIDLLDSSRGLSQRQVLDVMKYSIPSLLRYEDRNSMGHGVETRLPFMDFRLVEFAIALPSALKIKNGYGKWLMRSLTKELVPDFIRLDRSKRGFDVTQNWIEQGLGDYLRLRILSSKYSADYCREGVDLESVFSIKNIEKSSGLLEQALNLLWLINYREKYS